MPGYVSWDDVKTEYDYALVEYSPRTFSNKDHGIAQCALINGEEVHIRITWDMLKNLMTHFFRPIAPVNDRIRYYVLQSAFNRMLLEGFKFAISSKNGRHEYHFVQVPYEPVPVMMMIGNYIESQPLITDEELIEIKNKQEAKWSTVVKQSIK